jgi:hypothetical protein
MRNIAKVLVVISLIFLPALLYAAASDYLLLQNINSYKFITQSRHPLTKKTITTAGFTSKNAPGFLAGADHFDVDHDDITYETVYESDITDLGVRVQVTQHAGGDSDKWMLHELEDSYRSNDQSRLGLLSRGAVIKRLVSGGDRIFSIRMGGGTYAWISNNVVIVITYRDFQGNQPEPREVIQAYLQKFPSTIPTALVLDQAHDIQWIKDEMDRRLWLCDKWFAQLQAGTVQQNDAYRAEVRSMNVFLDYREKYYGIAAVDDKKLLSGYLSTNNGTSIQTKLTAYKTWWNQHKGDAITIL